MGRNVKVLCVASCTMCSTSKRGGFYADRLYHQEAGCNSTDGVNQTKWLDVIPKRDEPDLIVDGCNSARRDEPDQEDDLRDLEDVYNLIMLRRHDQFERSNKMTPCVWI